MKGEIERMEINYTLYFFAFFEKVIKKNYWHFVTGKTAKSILISCGARLAPFDIAELRELTRYDEMELDMLGDQKTAIVEIDAGDTYAYDAEALQSQKAREDAAKQRIFAILPEEQAQELIAIFDEFEEYETAESKFAHAMDNI